jgi:hypothetical protein
MTTVSREDFLAALFAEAKGMVELRAVPPGKHGPVPQSFTAVTSGASRESFIARHPTDNLYFGCATRADASSGELKNCWDVGCVWCDIDFKDIPEEEARRLVLAFPVPPSISVRSGGGVHLYWLLRARVAVTDPQLRRALEGLARALRGDHSAAEPARCLRLPGTTNKKYDPPRDVIVTRFEPTRRVALDDLLPHLPVVPAAGPHEKRAPGVLTLSPLAPVVDGCDFVRWCRDHQAAVSEPLWHALLSNLSRCEGGRDAAHAFSREHGDYTAPETDAKFDHARAGSDPITCARIQALGFTGCPPGGHGVGSPAALGLRRPDVTARATAVVAALREPPPIHGAANGAPAPAVAAPPIFSASCAAPPAPTADAPVLDTDPANPRPTWTRWDAADDWKFPPPAYLIDQLLPCRGVMWVAGVAHSGKSLLLEYLALAVACGREQAAQHFAITAPPDLKIVYVSQEDPGGRTEQRRDEIVAAWGQRPAAGRLTFLIKEGIDLLNPAHVTELRNLCLELGATVLVLDTWTALSPTADPLAAKEQAQLAQIVVALADAIGGLVIVVDHARKNAPDGGPQTLADLFGPSQKAQRAEHALLLRMIEGPERRIEVFVDGKDGDGIERFFLERSAKDSNLEKFTYAGTVQAVAEKNREIGVQNRARVYALIPPAPDFMTKALIVTRLAPDAKTGNAPDGKPGLVKGSVERHLHALVDAERVQKTGSGRGTAYQRCAPPDASASGA